MNIFSFLRAALPQPKIAAEKKARWKIAGCSLPGTAHLRRGRTCEDSVGWFADDELLVIAVADGAGSAALPALGSALAVRTAINSFLAWQSDGAAFNSTNATLILGRTCQCVLNTISERSTELGVEPRDLASTLILVVANRDFCAAAQIGDGAVVLKDESGNLVSLATPTNGEFANETVLLGCTPWIDVCISSISEFPIKSIAVFTDGLQRLALRLPQGEPHAPFFMPLFDRLASLCEPEMEKVIRDFLDSPRVNARTDDDKSLVTAHFL